MKTIFTLTLCLWLLSCSTTNPEERFDQRITRLEQRLDSLTGTNSAYPNGSYSLDPDWKNNRCQAITKRGKQCKRKAKYKGYCWQHNN